MKTAPVERSFNSSFCFDDEQFNRIFPFHFVLDKTLCCISMGNSLRKICPGFLSQKIDEFFYTGRSDQELSSVAQIEQLAGEPVMLNSFMPSDLKLRGQFEYLKNKQVLVFVGAPWIETIEEISDAGLDLSDFAAHDRLVDLLFIIQTKEILNEDSYDMLNTIQRQHNAEQDLQHQLLTYANRMTALISNLHAGVLLENEYREVVFSNQMFCDLFHIPTPPAALNGADCASLSGEAKKFFIDEDEFMRSNEQRLHERLRVADERFETKDGRHFQRDFIPIWDGNAYLGQLWVYQDITETVNRKRDLQELKEFYEKILNSIPADIAVFNPLHEYLFVNPFAIGDPETRKWIIGKKDEDYCNHRNKPMSIATGRHEVFSRVMNQKKLMSWEETMVAKDGKLIHILRHMYPVLDANQEVEMVIGYGLDITKRINIEEKIQQSEERYRNLFDYSQALILTHDMHGRILSVNPSVSRVMGFAEEEIIGRHFAEFMPASDKKRVQSEYLDKIFANRETEGVIRIISKDGQKLYLLFKNYLFVEEGLEPYIIGFAQDITERIQAETELKLAKEATEQMARAKDRFLADMSHEIRTPMSGIMGIAELLQRTSLTIQQSEHLKLLIESANSLLMIVNDVLDLEKIIAGKLELEVIPFNIYDKVKSSAACFRFKAEEKDLRLEMNNDLPHELMVLGDPYRLGQLLNNLLGNAIKFTQEGTVSIHTRIIREQEKSVWIEYTVSDQGMGIPQNKIEQIFEPYTQARAEISRKYGGTGLGLAICKNLVNMQSGHIEVESIEGEGSVFKFVIPYEIIGSTLLVDDCTTEYDIAVLKGRKILVAEDVEINQYLVKHFLEELGCEFDIADDGEAAIRLLAMNKYDAILMDIQMPNLNGIEASRIIRGLSDKKKASVPIVALTANALKGASEKYFEAGIDEYLSKPFTKEQLFDVLSKVIHNQNTKIIPMPSLPVLPRIPVEYDLTMLERMSNGNQEFVGNMIKIFLDTMPGLLTDLSIACEQSDWETATRVAHKIKPTIDTLGISKLKDVIRVIEHNASKRENLTVVPEKFRMLNEVILLCIDDFKLNFATG